VTDSDSLLYIVGVKETDVVIFGKMDVRLAVLGLLNRIKLWSKDVLNFPVLFLLLDLAYDVNSWLRLKDSDSLLF
jgi:hypothetical protein